MLFGQTVQKYLVEDILRNEHHSPVHLNDIYFYQNILLCKREQETGTQSDNERVILQRNEIFGCVHADSTSA